MISLDLETQEKQISIANENFRNKKELGNQVIAKQTQSLIYKSLSHTNDIEYHEIYLAHGFLNIFNQWFPKYPFYIYKEKIPFLQYFNFQT